MAPKTMDEIEEVKADVKKILFILESDDKLGQEGLVNKVNRIDRALADWQTEYKIIKAKAAVYGSVGGGIIAALVYFFKAIAAKLVIFFGP